MKKRLLITSLLISTISLLLFWAISVEVYYKRVLEAQKDTLSAYVNVFEQPMLEDGDDGAKEMSAKLNASRVTFMSIDGEILGESADGITRENQSDRDEVSEAQQNGDGYAVRNSKSTGQTMIYYCKNLNGTLVRVAVPTSSIWDMFAGTLLTVGSFLVLDIVLCFIAAILLTYGMLSPIEDMVKNASLDNKVETKFSELMPLAKIINDKNVKNKSYMDALEKDKQLVEKIQNSKNEFVANVTHEMNTPLTSIHGFAELLKGGALNEEQTASAVDAILKQSEKMTALIASIINYDEIDNDNLPSYDVDVKKIVSELLSGLQPEIEERGLAVETGLEELSVLSRHEVVSQIAGNLIRNAIRYNKQGGVLRVFIDAHNQILTVQDTGIGISNEDLSRIFDRFFTVDKSHNGKNGGFGLGLAVVKKLCERYGFEVSAKSELGIGTTMAVKF